MTTESLFLSAAELVAYTGLDQPAAQERLLREWGFTVYRNRDNKVMLAREAVVRRQIGEQPSAGKQEPQLVLRDAVCI